MSTVKYFALLGIGFCLCANLAAKPKGCDVKLCSGPLYYYEEIGCTPIFDSATSCCPTRYNCDKLMNLPRDKCIVNGQVYSGSDYLPSNVLKNPCYHCSCGICSTPRCEGPARILTDCDYPMSPIKCCEFAEVCPDSPVVCNVDGKWYKAGETFKPRAEPEKICVCKQGYTGVNSEEFCISRKPSWCGNVIYRMDKVLARCAPIYGENAVLHGACSDALVCPEENDWMVTAQADGQYQTTENSRIDSDNSCMFGNVTMRIGEKIKGYRWGEDKQNHLISCHCEVPPVPTCRNHGPVTKLIAPIRNYEW